MSKLLVSLEDITMLRGAEKIQEVYFVFLGYDAAGSADRETLADTNSDLSRFVPEDQVLRKWYYFGVSPIFKLRRKHRHQFFGGYPIFYGEPTDIESFYFAVVESDAETRNIGKLFSEFMENTDVKPLIEKATTVAGVKNPTTELIKEGFGLLIKAVEVFLVNNKDDIRYTNVLTFKKSDDYMLGRHENLGNQRVAFTLEAEL